MFGEDHITQGLAELRRQELQQEAEAHRQVQQFKTRQQSIYGSLMLSVGNWLTQSGESLQKRYDQSLELASDPSAECATPC